MTVLNFEGSYADTEEGVQSFRPGDVICEGGELSCADSNEEGERHGS